jgi:predicted RNA methylase
MEREREYGERDRSQVSRWHFSMLHDHYRNEAYQRAIELAIRHAIGTIGKGSGGEGVHVLDIGSGSGLLAMMAARAAYSCSAPKVMVTTCEAVPALAATARRIIATNGYSAAIRVVGKHSTKMMVEGGPAGEDGENDANKQPAEPDMSRPADVLISEILDTGLIGEHMLPSLNDAKRRLLQPRALMVPSKATVVAVAIHVPDQVYPASLPLSKINVGLQAAGVEGADGGTENVVLNMKCFNRFRTGGSSYETVRLNDLAHTVLTPAFDAFHFDFTGTAAPTPLAREAELVVPVEHAGKCNAIAFWFKLDLFTEGDGPGPTLSTAPSPPDSQGQQQSSWNQALQFLKKPIVLEAGTPLKLHAKHTPTCISFTPM